MLKCSSLPGSLPDCSRWARQNTMHKHPELLGRPQLLAEEEVKPGCYPLCWLLTCPAC